jgi:hypothetical protein
MDFIDKFIEILLFHHSQVLSILTFSQHIHITQKFSVGKTYRAPRNVVATFTQSVTRWHFRKAKFVQSCNIQCLNFFERIC